MFSFHDKYNPLYDNKASYGAFVDDKFALVVSWYALRDALPFLLLTHTL